MTEEKKKKLSNLFAILSLFSSLIGLILCCFMYLSPFFCFASVVLSIISLIIRFRKNFLAYFGIIIGLTAFILSLIYVAFAFIVSLIYGWDVIDFFYTIDSFLDVFIDIFDTIKSVINFIF